MKGERKHPMGPKIYYHYPIFKKSRGFLLQGSPNHFSSLFAGRHRASFAIETFFLHLLDQNRWYIRRRHCIIVIVCYVKGCFSWRVTFLSLVCSTAFRSKSVLLHYIAFLLCVDPNGKKCLAKNVGEKKAISVQVSNTLCVYVSLFSCLIRRKSDTPLSTCDLTLGDLKSIQKKQ